MVVLHTNLIEAKTGLGNFENKVAAVEQESTW